MIDDIFDTSEKDKIVHMKHMARSYIHMIIGGQMYDIVGPFLIVSGGAFPDWFHNTRNGPKDIDVFVLNNDNAKNKLRPYLASNGFEKKDLEYLKQTNPGATHVQEVWEGNAVSHNIKYQFIYTDYSARKDLIAEFDYKHCMVSYDVGKNEIYITRSIYDAIANKQLIVNNDKRVAEWRRTKFLQRGYTEPVLKAGTPTLGEIFTKNYASGGGSGSSRMMIFEYEQT